MACPFFTNKISIDTLRNEESIDILHVTSILTGELLQLWEDGPKNIFSIVLISAQHRSLCTSTKSRFLRFVTLTKYVFRNIGYFKSKEFYKKKLWFKRYSLPKSAHKKILISLYLDGLRRTVVETYRKFTQSLPIL